MRTTFIWVVLGALLPMSSVAGSTGWSADPTANLPLADRQGDQVQVKLLPTSDGGFYASWYDNASGGYDVTLQRIDALGAEQWPHDGIVVADTGFDWVTDYGLAVDADDEAVVAFRDDREGIERITVARVAPTGTMLWGTDGIEIDRGAEFLGPPKVIGTTDDALVVAWTRDAQIRVRRLDLAGRSVWSQDVVFEGDEGASQYLADLQAAPEGGIVVSWVHTTSFYAPRHLRAQRLSADGQPMWGQATADGDGRRPLAVFDTGTLQYGNFPPFVADPSGGAVFAWYETDPVLQVRVQHVRADGSMRLPAGGLLTAASDPAVERVEPAMAYNPVEDEIYVFWREMHPSGPLDQWLRGQRIGPDGQRRWGESGILVEGHGAHEITQLQAATVDDDVVVAYVQKLAEGDQRVWARRLHPDGRAAWSSDRVAVSAVASSKSRLELSRGEGGMVVLGWQDGRAGNDDIYLQNVNGDGTLGPGGGPKPPTRLFLPRVLGGARSQPFVTAAVGPSHPGR